MRAIRTVPWFALVADDGDFGVGDFQAHQAMIGVEQKKNRKVGSGDFESLIGFAIRAGRARGLHGDGAGC